MKHPSHERFVGGMFLYMEILSLANKLFNKWVNKNILYNDVSSFRRKRLVFSETN